LYEEVGLQAEHVRIVARTRDWLRYEVPEQWMRRELRGNYRGQKQIWFLLRLVARDCDVCLRRSEKPEFDAWRWHPYWVPLEAVVEFKREVYQQALSELSRYVFRPSRRFSAGSGRRSRSHFSGPLIEEDDAADGAPVEPVEVRE